MKMLELLGLPEHKNDELGREAIARVIDERGYSDEEIQNLYKIALKSLPMPCDIVRIEIMIPHTGSTKMSTMKENTIIGE